MDIPPSHYSQVIRAMTRPQHDPFAGDKAQLKSSCQEILKGNPQSRDPQEFERWWSSVAKALPSGGSFHVAGEGSEAADFLWDPALFNALQTYSRATWGRPIGALSLPASLSHVPGFREHRFESVVLHFEADDALVDLSDVDIGAITLKGWTSGSTLSLPSGCGIVIEPADPLKRAPPPADSRDNEVIRNARVGSVRLLFFDRASHEFEHSGFLSLSQACIVADPPVKLDKLPMSRAPGETHVGYEDYDAGVKGPETERDSAARRDFCDEYAKRFQQKFFSPEQLRSREAGAPLPTAIHGMKSLLLAIEPRPTDTKSGVDNKLCAGNLVNLRKALRDAGPDFLDRHFDSHLAFDLFQYSRQIGSPLNRVWVPPTRRLDRVLQALSVVRGIEEISIEVADGQAPLVDLRPLCNLVRCRIHGNADGFTVVKRSGAGCEFDMDPNPDSIASARVVTMEQDQTTATWQTVRSYQHPLGVDPPGRVHDELDVAFEPPAPLMRLTRAQDLRLGLRDLIGNEWLSEALGTFAHKGNVLDLSGAPADAFHPRYNEAWARNLRLLPHKVEKLILPPSLRELPKDLLEMIGQLPELVVPEPDLMELDVTGIRARIGKIVVEDADLDVYVICPSSTEVEGIPPARQENPEYDIHRPASPTRMPDEKSGRTLTLPATLGEPRRRGPPEGKYDPAPRTTLGKRKNESIHESDGKRSRAETTFNPSLEGLPIGPLNTYDKLAQAQGQQLRMGDRHVQITGVSVSLLDEVRFTLTSNSRFDIVPTGAAFRERIGDSYVYDFRTRRDAIPALELTRDP